METERHNPSETTLRSKINSSYTHLSSTEQKIAAYVLEHPDKVIYNSVTQIADELNVAQSTVTRFCRSIGLRGFQELKIALARDMNNSGKSDSDEQKMNLPQRLAQISMNNIQDTLKTLDLDHLQQAVYKMLSAKKIVIYGVGESGPIAKLLKVKLIGLGLTVDAHDDVHLQMISAAHLSEQDVAIGISQNGSTKDVVNALRMASKSGATTICITGHGRSPITEASDLRLVCLSKGVSVMENDLNSKVAILFLIELIVISLSLYIHDKADHLNPWKTTYSILDKLY